MCYVDHHTSVFPKIQNIVRDYQSFYRIVDYSYTLDVQVPNMCKFTINVFILYIMLLMSR